MLLFSFHTQKRCGFMELISEENYEKKFLGLFRVCLMSFSDPIMRVPPWTGLASITSGDLPVGIS